MTKDPLEVALRRRALETPVRDTAPAGRGLTLPWIVAAAIVLAIAALFWWWA